MSACYTNISCAYIPFFVIIFSKVDFIMFNVCVLFVLTEYTYEFFSFRGCACKFRELVLINSISYPHELIVVIDLLVYKSFVLIRGISAVGSIIVSFFESVAVKAFSVLRVGSLTNSAKIILVFTVILTGNVSEVCCHGNLELAAFSKCNGGYRVIV